MKLNVEAAAATDIGLVRKTNEDSFGIDREQGLFIVCDGIGGARGGEIASRIAVETFLAIGRQEIALGTPAALAQERAVAAANRAVLARAEWDTCYRGMGTTLVAARLNGDGVSLINVGDSRGYLIRDEQATQITRDHSLVAERVRAGLMAEAEAVTSPLQSVITRAIGIESDVHPDLYEVSLQVDDALLLTSDGLTRYGDVGEVAGMIASAASSEEACQRLIAHAKSGGGADNITCIVLRFS